MRDKKVAIQTIGLGFGLVIMCAVVGLYVVSAVIQAETMPQTEYESVIERPITEDVRDRVEVVTQTIHIK